MSISLPNNFEDVMRRDALEASIDNVGGVVVRLLFYGAVAFLALGVVSSAGRAVLGITHDDVLAAQQHGTAISVPEEIKK